MTDEEILENKNTFLSHLATSLQLTCDQFATNLQLENARC